MALGLIIWFNSVKRVGNSQTAVYSNLQPVLAIIFAHAILGDAVGGGLAAGAAMVILGIFLTRKGRIGLPASAEADDAGDDGDKGKGTAGQAAG